MVELARYIRVAVRLIRKHTVVGLGVLAPQLLNQVRGYIVRRVVANHSNHEYAVRLEILVHEMLKPVFAYFRRLVDQLHSTLDPFVGFTRVRSLNPLNYLNHVTREHEQIPKPDGRENLLVE